MTRRDQITRDYLGGMTVRELSVKYGRTYGGIQTALWQWGVKLPAGERIRRVSAAKSGIAFVKPVWPDCPPEKLADYQNLRRYYTAREARSMLEAV